MHPTPQRYPGSYQGRAAGHRLLQPPPRRSTRPAVLAYACGLAAALAVWALVLLAAGSVVRP